MKSNPLAEVVRQEGPDEPPREEADSREHGGEPQRDAEEGRGRIAPLAGPDTRVLPENADEEHVAGVGEVEGLVKEGEGPEEESRARHEEESRSGDEEKRRREQDGERQREGGLAGRGRAADHSQRVKQEVSPDQRLIAGHQQEIGMAEAKDSLAQREGVQDGEEKYRRGAEEALLPAHAAKRHRPPDHEREKLGQVAGHEGEDR